MSKTIPSQDLIRKRAKASRALRNANLQRDPTCRICGQTKTFDDFPTNAVDYACLDCRSEYARRAYHKKRAAMSPKQLQKYRAQINRDQKEWRVSYLAAMSPDELAAYRLKLNAGLKAARDRVKETVYLAYGGYRCNCCGETERTFLSIDHINNDGASHRRDHGHVTGEVMHRWLIRNNFPSGFQVLCMNCQWGKRNNGGVCPHQVRRNDYPERE